RRRSRRAKEKMLADKHAHGEKKAARRRVGREGEEGRRSWRRGSRGPTGACATLGGRGALLLIGTDVPLGALERDDVPTFVRWFNAPEVRRHINWFEPMSRAREERWFENEYLPAKDKFLFGIEIPAGDGWLHVGSTSLENIDWKNRAASFGIVLGEKEYWGRGIGTEATRGVLRFAFGELGLNRVELVVFADNARAQRCYEKAGFRHEGTRRAAIFRDGRYQDLRVMAMLSSDPGLSPGSGADG